MALANARSDDSAHLSSRNRTDGSLTESNRCLSGGNRLCMRVRVRRQQAVQPTTHTAQASTAPLT